MSAFKKAPPEVQPVYLPTYPVMFVTHYEEGPEADVRCCCGHTFHVDAVVEQNLVEVDGQLKAACPQCYAMAGMSARQHINTLLAISTAVRRPAHNPGPGYRAWSMAMLTRLTDLLSHAIGLRTLGERIRAANFLSALRGSGEPIADPDLAANEIDALLDPDQKEGGC